MVRFCCEYTRFFFQSRESTKGIQSQFYKHLSKPWNNFSEIIENFWKTFIEKIKKHLLTKIWGNVGNSRVSRWLKCLRQLCFSVGWKLGSSLFIQSAMASKGKLGQNPLTAGAEACLTGVFRWLSIHDPGSNNNARLHYSFCDFSFTANRAKRLPRDSDWNHPSSKNYFLPIVSRPWLYPLYHTHAHGRLIINMQFKKDSILVEWSGLL